MPESPQCQWILPGPERRLSRWWRKLRRRRPELVQCGLYARHDSGHVPFEPGVYLRAPLLHPLDAWNAWRLHHCPCGRRLASIDTEGPVHDMQWESGGWVLHAVAIEWRFGSCGCVYRELCDGSPEGQA